jgi:hypothetical protein
MNKKLYYGITALGAVLTYLIVSHEAGIALGVFYLMAGKVIYD